MELIAIKLHPVLRAFQAANARFPHHPRSTSNNRYPPRNAGRLRLSPYPIKTKSHKLEVQEQLFCSGVLNNLKGVQRTKSFAGVWGVPTKFFFQFSPPQAEKIETSPFPKAPPIHYNM
jgi:hypothetical protein